MSAARHPLKIAWNPPAPTAAIVDTAVWNGEVIVKVAVPFCRQDSHDAYPCLKPWHGTLDGKSLYRFDEYDGNGPEEVLYDWVVYDTVPFSAPTILVLRIPLRTMDGMCFAVVRATVAIDGANGHYPAVMFPPEQCAGRSLPLLWK